jgi:hypothetical protein
VTKFWKCVRLSLGNGCGYALGTGAVMSWDSCGKVLEMGVAKFWKCMWLSLRNGRG